MPDAATLHRAMFDAVQSRDFTKLRSLYHPDYVYMVGDGVEQNGADAGVAVAQGYTSAFPDLTFGIRHQHVPNENVSIIELTARGTHKGELGGVPATNKHVTLIVCNVVEARTGKIYREREYYDQMAMMSQLGVMDGSSS